MGRINFTKAEAGVYVSDLYRNGNPVWVITKVNSEMAKGWRVTLLAAGGQYIIWSPNIDVSTFNRGTGMFTTYTAAKDAILRS